jgi:hypothetical protein
LDLTSSEGTVNSQTNSTGEFSSPVLSCRGTKKSAAVSVNQRYKSSVNVDDEGQIYVSVGDKKSTAGLFVDGEYN